MGIKQNLIDEITDIYGLQVKRMQEGSQRIVEAILAGANEYPTVDPEEAARQFKLINSQYINGIRNACQAAIDKVEILDERNPEDFQSLSEQFARVMVIKDSIPQGGANV